MKHGSNGRRPRSRGGKRPSNARSVFDSNGPDVKVRGTAQQVLDKYLTLARDAQSSGDRVQAEAYLQYAEHYFRILSADQAASNQGQNQGGPQQGQAPQDRGGEGNGEAKADSASDTQGAEPESDDAGAGEDEPQVSEKPKRRPRSRTSKAPTAA